jgi:SAM-dependent methyltransferase
MVTMDHDQPLHEDTPMPGDGVDASRMPGHWLLVRMGRRVLRPGGLELTRWMLDALDVGPDDRVVELAAGLGATARLTLARRPAAYTAVDRDPAAVTRLGRLASDRRTTMRAVRADAADTGLPRGCATVVYGEAMLTMQPEPARRRIVGEARRLLADASSRYGIHELCLLPDDIDQTLADRIAADLRDSLRVGARPLTAAGWCDLLASEGFAVTALRTTPMALLEPRRMVADEGMARALRIAGHALWEPSARRRLLHMRSVFRRHQEHLGAISLIAVPTPPAHRGGIP